MCSQELIAAQCVAIVDAQVLAVCFSHTVAACLPSNATRCFALRLVDGDDDEDEMVFGGRLVRLSLRPETAIHWEARHWYFFVSSDGVTILELYLAYVGLSLCRCHVCMDANLRHEINYL